MMDFIFKNLINYEKSKENLEKEEDKNLKRFLTFSIIIHNEYLNLKIKKRFF